MVPADKPSQLVTIYIILLREIVIQPTKWIWNTIW